MTDNTVAIIIAIVSGMLAGVPGIVGALYMYRAKRQENQIRQTLAIADSSLTEAQADELRLKTHIELWKQFGELEINFDKERERSRTLQLRVGELEVNEKRQASEIANLTGRIAKLQSELDEARAEIRRLREQRDDGETTIQELKAENKKLRQELEHVMSQLDHERRMRKKLEREYEELERRFNQSQEKPTNGTD